MNPIRALIGDRQPARSLLTPADFAWLTFDGGGFWQGIFNQTLTGKAESVENNFEGYVKGAYKRGGVIAAVAAARVLALGQIRLLFQEWGDDGRPGEFRWSPDLELLRRPQRLIAKMELHNSLAGNAYSVLHRGKVRVLRPDWVTIVRASFDEVDDPMDADLIGYRYKPGGQFSQAESVSFMPDEVAHYAPMPDPISEFRGMSWMTPVLRQILSHQAAAEHKEKFFVNGATANVIFKFDPSVAMETVRDFRDEFAAEHQGSWNAYKTIFLGGGADPQVIGMDFKQLDFKSIQGADETLMAAAGGVPPIIANLSEGIASATYSNYGQAKRHFNDTTISYLAGELAGALEMLVPPPQRQRLWYDIRDVPFFRDDAKSEAEVQQIEAAILRSLADGGWDPPSVVAAIKSQGDWAKLKHTGKLSVQLQEPGSTGSQRSDPWQLAQIVQKIYLGVGVVLTAEEARQIINDAGGNLPGDLPALPTPPTDPVPDTDEEPTT